MQIRDGFNRRSTFLLVTLIVTLGTLAAVSYTLWRLRAETIKRHLETAVIHARAFEDHLTHSFNVIDLTLSTIADDAATPRTLAAALLHAPYLRSLSLLDANGRISVSSNPANVGSTLPREDCVPPFDGVPGRLHAGRPWVGRDFGSATPIAPHTPAAPDDRTLLPVLRMVLSDRGQLVPLAAAVNPDYFLNYYSRNLVEDVGSVDLLRHDGVLLLSTDPASRPGQVEADTAFRKRIATEDIGHLEQVRADDRTMLTAFRASSRFPYVVVVRLDKEAVLDDWQSEAERTTAITLAVLAVAFAIAALYFVRLERAARLHDANLEKMRLLGAALEATANAIIITDRNGIIEWANPAFSAISGYSFEEAIGRNPRELIRSGVQPAATYQELWETILAGRVWRGELINRRKDDSVYPEDQTVTPVCDATGIIRHFVAVKQDITERKQSEQRMAELSRHIVAVQESARRRLSGELHDRTSPNLAAIGVSLDIVEAALAADRTPHVADRLADIRALLADTTASIREICSDLRPPILDYGGLVAALESYVRQFQRRTGIETRFVCAERELRLMPATESVLFRVAQEALTNSAKHARAREITVKLESDAEHVQLTVVDDGIGFAPARLGSTAQTGGQGILTMREMAEFSGGRFVLEAEPGSGTRVQVTIQRKETPG